MATLMPEQDLLARALTTDDPVQLIAQVKETLLNGPNDAIALAAQGVALQRGGDQPNRADVLLLLLKAANEASDDQEIWPRIARAVHSIGLSENFLDELKKRANSADAGARDWRLLGKFQYFLDRNDDAVVSLTEATTRDASSALAWFGLAIAAVDAQKPGVTLNAIAQIVRLDPENESVPVVEGLKIAALSIGGRPLEALDIWRARQLPVTEPDIQARGIQLAGALLASKPAHTQEVVEVIDQIEPLIAKPSHRWAALRIKTQALIVATEYEEALAVLETAASYDIDKREKADVRFWQAVALERSGHAEEALARTDAALSLEPSDDGAAIIRLVRARLLNNKGEYQRALDDLGAIKPQLLSEDVGAEFMLHQGVALVGLGQNALALERLNEARSLDQNSELLPSILYWQGRALTALKRFEEALSAFDEAFKSGFSDSERSALYFGEALALWGLGRIDATIEKVDQAIELSSSKRISAELLISKARLLGSQKKVEAAFAALDSALNMTPDKSEQGVIELEKAVIAQAAGPDWVSDALKSADAALAALGEQDVTKAPRTRALDVRAWALRIQGDYAGALEVIERIEMLEPAVSANLDFIIFRWETLLMLGRNNQALDLIQNILNGHSVLAGHSFLRMALGETLRRMGEVAGYFAELAEATKVPPEHAGDARAWLAAALAGVATRRLEEAGDAIEHLKVLDGSLFDSPLVQVLRAQVLTGKGEFLAALDLVPQNLELAGPWKIMAAQTRAQALSETGELSQALIALDQIVALAATTPEIGPEVAIFALCMKANCLVRVNRNEAALAVLSEIQKLPASGGMAEFVELVEGLTKAIVLNRLGKNDDALRMINTAIQAERAVGTMFPSGFLEPGRTLWIKGVVLFESAREEEALGAFEQAQQAGLPGNEALIWQGRALLALEDPDRALRAFEAAIKEAASRQDSVQQFEALVGKGRALHDEHAYDAAVATYREALRLGGETAETNANYWRRLGESYYALGRFEAAMRAFRRGQKIESNANLSRGISAILIRQKRYRDAEMEARELASKDPALSYNRGLALWALGDKDEAKRIINEASDAGVIEATEFARALKKKRDAAGGWWETWFGEGVGRTRFIVGTCLLLSVGSALAAPAFAYLQNTLDWKAALVPAAVGLVLLLIPSIKGLSLSTEGVKLEIEPSALGDSGDTPNLDLVPLGSGFYLITASLQSMSNPPGGLKRPELEDPSLRILSGQAHITQVVAGSVVSIR